MHGVTMKFDKYTFREITTQKATRLFGKVQLNLSTVFIEHFCLPVQHTKHYVTLFLILNITAYNAAFQGKVTISNFCSLIYKRQTPYKGHACILTYVYVLRIEKEMLWTIPCVPTVVFHSSISWSTPTSPKRLSTAQVITTNIHVNDLTRQLEENTGKCASGTATDTLRNMWNRSVLRISCHCLSTVPWMLPRTWLLEIILVMRN